MMISPEGGIYTKDIKRENYDREADFYTSTVLGANLVLAKRKTTRAKWANSVVSDCDPMDYSLSDSSVHGIFQARILSGLPFPTPGDLPDPGIDPGSPTLRADSLPSEPPGKPYMGIAIWKEESLQQRIITFCSHHDVSREAWLKVRGECPKKHFKTLFLTTSFLLSLSAPKLKIPLLINLIRDVNTLACEDRHCLHPTGAHLLRL